MFSSLLKKQPVLDEETIAWLFNAYAWSERQLAAVRSVQDSQLIEPSNRFFPGREDSVQGMAALIFEQVKSYAGVAHWPCQLIDRYQYDEEAVPVVGIHEAINEQKPLIVLYEPMQVRNPEVMIANYVYVLAYYMAELAEEPLPCDEAQWPCLLELLGVVMGFGVMFVNTASPKRVGGCGNCRSPLMERQGQLSENEATYALAIFCVLRDIPAKQATPLIKNYQRSFFKKAVQDVKERETLLGKCEKLLPKDA